MPRCLSTLRLNRTICQLSREKKTPVPLPAIESKVLTAWVSLADGQSIAVCVEVHTRHTLER